MISHELQSLAETFAKYRETGLELEPFGVASMVAVLNKLTADAEAMERTIIPALARLDAANMPEGVVAFRGAPPWGWSDRPSTGGDAA